MFAIHFPTDSDYPRSISIMHNSYYIFWNDFSYASVRGSIGNRIYFDLMYQKLIHI